MTTRKYSSRSQQTSLTAALTSSGITATVVSGAALLGGATISAGETFTIVIDPDTALEEIVDIYSASGSPVSTNTLTIVRGVENAGIGVAHSAGAIVRHMLTGRDLRESNTHIESTTGHGATGAVVGTTNTQTLTNKTLTSPTITGTGAIAGTFTGNITGNVTGNVSGNAGTVTNGVYTTDTGTVTSTMIANGTIVDADINSSAAIAKTKVSGTAITAADTGTVTSTMIANDTIVNTDINTSAQIAYGKLNLTNTIVNADINASAAIDKTKISGTAITAADTGTVTSTLIADGTIVNGDINTSAAIALSKLATDPLARANHTGTQAASTISDFDTQVRTSRLDQMAAPTASVSANSQKITNLATPTSNTDAATKAYADQMILATEKGASNGVATLGSDGKLTTAQIPDVTITDTSVVSSQAAMLALTAQVGDVAIRTDLNKSFILKTAGASTLANWQELLTPTDSVLSVDGQTGAVSLSSTYATIANAANKLPLAGGTMSGNIAMGSNKITGLGTPTTTGDAATKDYADTKLPLAGGTMTGAVAMGTNKITGLGDPTNAQDAATKNYIDTTVIAPSNLTGVITSVGNVTSIASRTGTGTKFVVDTSPTLVTPNIGVATATSINGTTIPSSKTLVATDSTAYVVPSQTGNTGKYLKTDGTTSSWQTVDSLPSQTNNAGKVLGTNGTAASWTAGSYSVYQGFVDIGSTTTASVAIPAGDYLYETPAAIPTSFTLNSQTKSDSWGKITVSAPSTTIGIVSAGGYINPESPFPYRFSQVAYNGTKYLALMESSGYVYESSDLTTWSYVTNPGNYYNTVSLAYGNGIFCGIWGGSNGVKYSTDQGSSWTTFYGDIGGNMAASFLPGRRRMIFDGTNFVILSVENGKLFWSSDCISWSSTSSAIVNGYDTKSGISYANGKYFVWDGDNGRMKSGTSKTNIGATTPVYVNNTPATGTYSSPVYYSNSLYWYAGMSNNNSNCYIYSSPDGITWTTLTVKTFADGYAAYYPPIFVVDGNSMILQSGSASEDGTMYVSTNAGSTWSVNPDVTSYGLYWMEKVNTTWVGQVGGNNYNAIRSSSLAPVGKATYVKLTPTSTAS